MRWYESKTDLANITSAVSGSTKSWSLEEYTPEQRRMFECRPGITGWAQINGRKGVMWPKRIEMNVWYVDNVSILLDLKILFLTAAKVLSNADNENTGATVNGENIEN